MYDVRAKRVWPGTDDKLLTDWTALAISAFALAARILDEPRYEKAARDAADRILRNCVRDGELLHREKAGRADIPGFSTDYAYLIEALLDLYEATFEPRYFTEAARLQDVFEEKFADPLGGYFLAAAGHDGLIVRPKESYDGATPSSNSVAAMNLLRLSVFTGEEACRRRAEAIFARLRGFPRAGRAGVSAAALRPRLLHDSPREVVLSGRPGRKDFEDLRTAVFASPGLNRVLVHADSAAGIPQLEALSEGRAAGGRQGDGLRLRTVHLQGSHRGSRRPPGRLSTPDEHGSSLRRAISSPPGAVRASGAPR